MRILLALFCLALDAAVARLTLQDMGYTQQATKFFCDNTTAVGIANDNIKQRRSKSIDMRYHWLRDRVRLGHFEIAWRRGEFNLADFFTKPYSVKQIKAIRHFFVLDPKRDIIRENARANRIQRRIEKSAIQEGVLIGSDSPDQQLHGESETADL